MSDVLGLLRICIKLTSSSFKTCGAFSSANSKQTHLRVRLGYSFGLHLRLLFFLLLVTETCSHRIVAKILSYFLFLFRLNVSSCLRGPMSSFVHPVFQALESGS
eukprot:TRINITY_DN23016_c0_g1_i1.p1 TRINITY_DN23016_c0_g1~~TRINITY_DN23016_c0_g1_i1.p1  ORF type:complete len:104 (+),score=1.48 TRINITY_DN23016_c0_g1_i1:292-603(+)